MRLIIRWLVTAASLVVAVYLVPGISVGRDAVLAVLVTALVLGLVNAFIRPILKFLSCGFIALTLGLFIFIINAGCLWLASWLAQNVFGLSFVVDGFWPALWGAIVVSIASWLLNMFVPDVDKDSD